MKFTAIIFFLCFSYGLHAQLKVNVQWTEQTSLSLNDVVYYNPENKLVWGHFKGKPEEAGRTAAITMSGFGYTANAHSSGQSGQLDIRVYCFFNKNRSWVKPGKNTPYILTHEQRHFDVSYIAANDFIEKVRLASFNSNNYNKLITKLYEESISEMNRMQDDYDEQTKNGQDKVMQQQWDRTIETKLAGIIN